MKILNRLPLVVFSIFPYLFIFFWHFKPERLLKFLLFGYFIEKTHFSCGGVIHNGPNIVHCMHDKFLRRYPHIAIFSIGFFFIFFLLNYMFWLTIRLKSLLKLLFVLMIWAIRYVILIDTFSVYFQNLSHLVSTLYLSYVLICWSSRFLPLVFLIFSKKISQWKFGNWMEI
jgi:hypothetical protein